MINNMISTYKFLVAVSVERKSPFLVVIPYLQSEPTTKDYVKSALNAKNTFTAFWLNLLILLKLIKECYCVVYMFVV